MPTIGDFINTLAIQAGIPADNEDLKNVLSAIGGSTVTVPDTLTKEINRGLLTLDAARNNDTLKDHFYALFANGGEAHLKRVAEELGWDAQTTEQVMAEKTLMAKYSKLVEKVRAAHDAGKKPAKEVEEQIAKLNADLLAAREAAKTAVEQERTAWVSRLQNQAIEGTLASFEYGIDLPKEIAIETAKALVNRKLAEAKYKVGYDPDNNAISLQTEAGLAAYENNAPVVFKDFASRILADNKLLKVAAPAPPAPGNPPKPASGWNPVQVPVPANNGKPAPAGLDALMAAQAEAAQAFNH